MRDRTIRRGLELFNQFYRQFKEVANVYVGAQQINHVHCKLRCLHYTASTSGGALEWGAKHGARTLPRRLHVRHVVGARAAVVHVDLAAIHGCNNHLRFFRR